MKRYKSWFILLAALLLAACSEESGQTVTPVDPQPRPDTIPTPVVQEATLNFVGATRAGDGDTYNAAEAWDIHSPIQFFLMSGTTDENTITQRREGEFLYDPEASVPGWYSTIGIKDPYNCIYGYSPATVGLCTISTVDGSTSYRNGAVMNLTKLSAASGNDLCVIVGLRHGTTKAATDATPDRGQFYFNMGSDNYVSLLLDHLFARIDFNIKIGTEYSKRRYIKIKKLELQSTYELTGVTVRLTPTTTTPEVTYTTVAAAADAPSTGVIYDFTMDADNPEGKELSVGGTLFPGYFAPGDGVARSLSMVCTYDVYSIDIKTNKIGTRVREDCVAVNDLSRLSGLVSMTRGKRTTINLTVEPTYLYQLSDDELDNPTIVVSE